jgi:hypothetical protein
MTAIWGGIARLPEIAGLVQAKECVAMHASVQWE